MFEPDHLRGIVTVLNTPFNAHGEVHIPSLRANVRRAIDARVAGFLVPAMASEVHTLSEIERTRIVETVLEEAGTSAIVIGGASAPDSDARVRLTRQLIDIGCPGVLVSIPFENERHYEAEVRKIASLQPGFLMLQDWDFGGSGLPVPMICRLFHEIEIFRCLKIEVVPSGPKYTQLLDATAGRLHLSGGWAVMQMIEALDRGVHAFMPTAMHGIYTQIHRLYAAGRREEALQLFERLLPVLAFSNQHLDISIHFFKRLLFRQGVYATDRTRAQLLPFDAHHCRIANGLIERVTRIESEIDQG